MSDGFDDWDEWDEIDELEAEAGDVDGFHDDRLVHDGWHDDEGGGQVSAWDVGTGFALAGWLLDRQTDRIVEAVRATPPAGPPPPQPAAAPEAARLAIDWEATPLQPGDTLKASGLAVTLAVHVGSRRPLRVTALPVHPPGPTGADDLRWEELAFRVIVTAVPGDPPVVLALRRAPGAFADRHAPPGYTVPAGDPGHLLTRAQEAQTAVDVLHHALLNHGLYFDDFRWAADA